MQIICIVLNSRETNKIDFMLVTDREVEEAFRKIIKTYERELRVYQQPANDYSMQQNSFYAAELRNISTKVAMF